MGAQTSAFLVLFLKAGIIAAATILVIGAATTRKEDILPNRETSVLAWTSIGLVLALTSYCTFFAGLKLGVLTDPTPETFWMSALGSVSVAITLFPAGLVAFTLLWYPRLNTKHLNRPVADLLATLLHELLHEWQELHGKPSSSKYHNVEFRQKAESFGLVIDKWGHNVAVVPGPFTELLARYGVDPTSVLKIPPEPARTPEASKMKKCSCRCTNVRCAVELHATCLSCGAAFERTTPIW